MRFAMIRCPRTLLLALGCLVLPSGAQAAVSISITSPTPGPIHDVRSQVVVNYASDDPAHPLVLSSLSVTVNGAPWVSKFAVGPSSASYQITGDDVLVAGQLMIVASISDDAGTTASVSQTYDVFPSLVEPALAPDTAEVGDTIVVRADGLDPAPSRNKLLLSPAGNVAEFKAVDRVNGEGTVEIPPGTVTGTVQLEVNGKRSRETPDFHVPPLVPNCGRIHGLQAMANGSWVASYYNDSTPESVDPVCPPAELTTPWPRTRWRVVEVRPSGEVRPIRVSQRNGIGIGIGRYGVRVAVNKERTKVAVVTKNTVGEPGVVAAAHVYYDGRVTYAPLHMYAADFDSEGNLYGTSLYEPSGGSFVRLSRLSRESLAAGGHATPETIIDMPVNPKVFLSYLAVSCDGFAYVGIDEFLSDYPWVQPRLFKVDLSARTVVSSIQLGVGESLETLTLSCHTNELWGARWLNLQENDTADLWRAEVTETGILPPETVVPLAAVGWPFGVTVGPSGNLYLYVSRSPSWGTAVLAKRAAVEVCPDVGTALPICACPDGLTRGPNQTCEQFPLVVTTNTTRWKPQRADTPIEVHFTGPDDVNLAIPGRLEIRPPSPALPTTVTAPLEVIGAGCTAGNGKRCYRLTWSGPWTYEDSGVVKRLPPGNYTVVVNAVAGTTPPLRDIASAPYDKVSLVEVKKVDLAECGSAGLPSCQDGGARLANNAASNGTPMPGGGKAAFPDATQQGNNYRRTVLVKAELEPNLGPDAGQVIVHFKWYDVDDPSAGQDANGNPIATDPVDNDKVNTPDNRPPNGDTAVIVQSAPASPELGGAAVSYFKVSTTQGNNYRLAASTHAPWLADLCGVVSSTTGELVHGPCTTSSNGTALSTDPWNNEAAMVSEMLTVWRTLHVELDRLDSGQVSQASKDITGRWTDVGNKRLKDTARSFYDQWHPDDDDWVGAILNPYTPGENPACVESFTVRCPFRVKSSKEHVVKTDRSGVDTTAHKNAPPNSPEREYYIREDHLGQYSQRQHDVAILRRLLEPAYIRTLGHPDLSNPADTLNANPLLGWNNTIDGAIDERAILGLPRDIGNSEPFWSVQLILALEGLHPALTIAFERGTQNRRTSTNDPTQELTTGLFGLTVPSPPNPLRDLGATLWLQFRDKPVSVSFPETIRDAAATLTNARIRPTALVAQIYLTNQTHEVLHSLTLGHDGGLMCATLANYGRPGGLDITRKQLARLRGISRPDAATPPDVGCPAPGNDLVNCCPAP